MDMSLDCDKQWKAFSPPLTATEKKSSLLNAIFAAIALALHPDQPEDVAPAGTPPLKWWTAEEEEQGGSGPPARVLPMFHVVADRFNEKTADGFDLYRLTDRPTHTLSQADTVSLSLSYSLYS